MGAAMLSVLFLSVGHSAPSSPGEKRKNTVTMIFFLSRDCPKCETIKDLIEILQVKYPLRVRRFDISKEADYAVFKAVDSIHGTGSFAVPLVMLGESILIGEQEIALKLEEAVKDLTTSGGSPSPYIGPIERKPPQGRPTQKAQPRCESCSRGGPSSLGDEWQRVRGYLDKLF
jgi:hypothetical protein